MFRCAAACALAGALAACSAPAEPSTSLGAAGPDRGERLYESHCVACHQPDARGIAGAYPSLVGSAVLLGDPTVLTRWVIDGQRPVSLPAGRYVTEMPRFGWMKAADAAALFTYLRTHLGNAGSPVDAPAVTRALGP